MVTKKFQRESNRGRENTVFQKGKHYLNLTGLVYKSIFQLFLSDKHWVWMGGIFKQLFVLVK